MAKALLACSSEDHGTVGRLSQALSDSERILGFEAPSSDWSSPQATIVLSTTASQGEHSLSVAPSGWTEITSVPLSNLGTIGDEARIDIQLPGPVGWGEARLVVKIPSLGVHWAELGPGQALSGLSAGVFHTLEFPLGDAKSVLQSTYSDLQVILILNVSSGGAPILVDNLTFGTGGSSSEPAETLLAVSLPVNADLGEIALAASNSVLVGSQSVINGQVANSGDGPLELQASSKAGTLVSRGPLLLRDSAFVEGDATTSGAAERQNNVVVTGTLLERISMGVRDAARWSVRIPTTTGESIQLEPDTVRQVSPDAGHLLTLRVQPRARAILRSGQYFLKSLEVASEGILEIDDTDGPVVLYVEEGFSYQGVTQHPLDGTADSVAAPQLLIVHMGASSIYVRSPVRGTVLAPEAEIIVATYEGPPHEASFLGRSVQVQGSVTVNATRFNWNAIEQFRKLAGADYGALHVAVPRGTNLRNMVAGARDSLQVGQGAEITGVEDAVVTVALGPAAVDGAESVGIIAQGGATLGPGAWVNGDLLSVATSTIASGATVTGTVADGLPLSPPDTYTIPFVFPPPDGGDLLIRQGRSRIVWPDHYRSLTVEPGGRIYIGSGDYQFAEVEIGEGAEVIVSAHEGPVQVLVSGSFHFAGEVRGLGESDTELFVGYAGDRPVSVRGAFRGAIVAPRAPVTVTEGEHSGFFYGASLDVAGARITPGYTPWDDVLPPEGEPDAVFTSDAQGGVLTATDTSPGTFSHSDGFELRIPRRIPVEVGNAGNHDAILRYRIGGTFYTCTYRGGATVSHPTSLLELARGRAYRYVSCSDGSEPGTVHIVDFAELSISADPQAEGGVTRAVLGVGDTCDGFLEQPIPPDESREMIESFTWPSTHVAEHTADDRPALYYANVYVTSSEELERLDALLIHWQSKPLFPTELPEDYEDRCGTINFDGDGEGLWIFAVMPGATYNAILDARTHPDIPADQREIFRAVKLRPLPNGAAEADGSIKYSVLQDAGFHYMGLTELPDDVALDVEVLPRGGSVAKIVNAVEFVFQKAKDAVREGMKFLGTLDELFAGKVRANVQLSIVNQDARFDSPDHPYNRRVIRRAWGPGAGNEITPRGIRATMYTLVIRPWTIVPVTTANGATLSSNGMASFSAAKGGSGFRGHIEFLSLCFEKKNRAGMVTSFLLPNEMCNGKNPGFSQFSESRTVRTNVSNLQMWMQTELTDSFDYLREIVGVSAKPAKLLTGFNAYAISGFSDLVWAPCFGYGDLLVDTVAPLLDVPIPALSIYLSTLLTSDIIAAPGKASIRDRGLISHEYGHYALCTLSKQLSGKVTQDVVLTWDTIAAGQGNPDPDEEARVINEAFADFFAGQVAGAYDYFEFLGQSSGQMNVAVRRPGLDHNHFSKANGELAVGRLATLLQDLFDGHPKLTPAPSSGDAWEEWMPGKIDWSDRTDGDTDPEQISLSGVDVATFASMFFEETDAKGAYRYDPFERAVARLIDHRNYTWCQACLAMAPHFVAGFGRLEPLDNRVKELLQTCVSNSRLAELLGPPPHPVDAMNGHECDLCPSFQGMVADGTCDDCVTDLSLDWSTLAASQTECTAHEIPFTSVANDNCPSQVIVRVENARQGTPLQSITPGVTLPLSGDEEVCQTHEIGGLIADGETINGAIVSDLTSFYERGTWVEPFGCTLGRLGIFPDFDSFAVSGDTVNITTNAGDLQANVRLRSFCPNPIIR